MSSDIKHHHARASQELAQPIDKVSREGSSVGEQGCCPNPETIYEKIVKLGVDVVAVKMEKIIAPKYDSQAFEKHLRGLIKEHASHCLEHDASKSDEKARERKIERISEIITKDGDKIAHELFTKFDKVRIHVHDVQATKAYLHELGVQLTAQFGVHSHETVDKPVRETVDKHIYETVDKPVHETVDDKFDKVDEIACKDYDKVSENPFDELITESDAETDNTYVEVRK